MGDRRFASNHPIPRPRARKDGMATAISSHMACSTQAVTRNGRLVHGQKSLYGTNPRGWHRAQRKPRRNHPTNGTETNNDRLAAGNASHGKLDAAPKRVRKLELGNDHSQRRGIIATNGGLSESTQCRGCIQRGRERKSKLRGKRSPRQTSHQKEHLPKANTAQKGLDERTGRTAPTFRGHPRARIPLRSGIRKAPETGRETG